MIIDCALYENGRRRPGTIEIEDALEATATEGSYVWIRLAEPTADEFDRVRHELNLHPLAIEDALKSHQRPKLEVFGDSLFLVLRPVSRDQLDHHELGELHVFAGERFVVSVRHRSAPALDDAQLLLEHEPDRLLLGPGAVVHAICDQIVDGFLPVIEDIEARVDEIEELVFANGESSTDNRPAEQIFRLKRRVLNVQRNVSPLIEALDPIARGQVPLRWTHEQLSPYFRDVLDHVLRESARIESARELLTAALEAHLAQVGLRQNEDMRTISAWAGIIAVPTLLAGIWGMNFRQMPELEHWWGYPLAISSIVLTSFFLWRYFHRSGWL